MSKGGFQLTPGDFGSASCASYLEEINRKCQAVLCSDEKKVKCKILIDFREATFPPPFSGFVLCSLRSADKVLRLLL